MAHAFVACIGISVWSTLWLAMSKVLIVDDQPAACLAIQVLLETYGLDSPIANNPAGALDLVATANPWVRVS